MNESIKLYATNNMTYTPFKGFHEIDLPFLLENGIEMVSNINEADIIVSQHFKQLKPIFLKYGNSKKYLIWTLEPRFNTHLKPVKKFYFGMMTCHVMNIYTGDVFVNPLSFHSEGINTILNYFPDNFELPNRKTVGLMSYYKGLDTEKVLFNAKDVDLIKKRTEIAFYGHSNGLITIYGNGWPDNISIEDSRQGNWGETKSAALDNYFFNLCFENTAAPRYTTEKIWGSIAGYCLPIYYSAGTEIYDLFPRDSFIDYSILDSPKALFNLIENMSSKEYTERFNKCVSVYNSISALSKTAKYDLRKTSLNRIVEKLKSI